jgi:hypothetical protein
VYKPVIDVAVPACAKVVMTQNNTNAPKVTRASLMIVAEFMGTDDLN